MAQPPPPAKFNVRVSLLRTFWADGNVLRVLRGVSHIFIDLRLVHSLPEEVERNMQVA